MILTVIPLRCSIINDLCISNYEPSINLDHCLILSVLLILLLQFYVRYGLAGVVYMHNRIRELFIIFGIVADKSQCNSLFVRDCATISIESLYFHDHSLAVVAQLYIIGVLPINNGFVVVSSRHNCYDQELVLSGNN